MLVVDEKFVAWFGIGETYAAGKSRLAVIGYAAHRMAFREFLVRWRGMKIGARKLAIKGSDDGPLE